MIRIVQGNPGSGKSYYAVNYLSKFCTYDPLYKDHKLNDGTLIISNLEGLKLKHLDLDALIQRFTIEKFLTIENFEIIIDKYKARHIILIIDEAQKYLDSKFYNKDVFYFFQYHRHIGIDIFMMTQSVSTVCRQLPPLCEFIIEAAPRSKGIAGTFRYKFKDTKGTFMYSQAVRKKQEVFGMYKSFSSDEAEKPKNVLTHWILVFAVIAVIITVGFKGFFAAYASKGKKHLIAPSSVPVQRPISSANKMIIAPLSVPSPPVPPPIPRPSIKKAFHESSPLPALSVIPITPKPIVSAKAPEKLTVIGLAGSSLGSKLYLLSNGKSARSDNEYEIGDGFN